jgi:hypothetical protein
MGVSTNACLFFGAELGDRYETEGILFPNAIDVDVDVHDYIVGKLSEADLLEKVELGVHCHYDDPVYYLYSREFTACRGFSQPVDDLTVGEGEVAVLKRALDVLGIPDAKLGWRLASYWG